MVFLHVKRDQKSLFLAEAKTSDQVGEILTSVVQIHNGRLKVFRICDEVESLANHGVAMPLEMQGLLEEQIAELKLTDEEGDEKCIPSGGFDFNKDPLQKRNGKAPKPNMKEILEKTVLEARKKISEETVKANETMSWTAIKEAMDILRGAVAIVYPMGLPTYDPIRMELENREEFDTTAAAIKEVIDGVEAVLWFANKEMKREKILSDYIGKNEKSKIIVKLTTKRAGQPASESWLSPETQKKLALENFKRMEELKKLERDEDDSYLNSSWADSQALKRKFQGLNNIAWKP